MALSTTNLSLNQIMQVFAMFADRHAILQSFGQGFEDEYVSTTVINYPLLWVSVLPSKFQDNLIQYNFRVIVCDLVDPDKKNALDVQSDSLQILWDLVSTIRDINDLEIIVNSDATPFEELKDDRVAGHYIDIGILAPRVFGACNVPFDECSPTILPHCPSPVNSTWEVPEGIVGQEYFVQLEIPGDGPFDIQVDSKPDWMTISLDEDGIITLSGIPTVRASDLIISFLVSNCGSQLTEENRFEVDPFIVSVDGQPQGNLRITEDADIRITEDGDFRIIED